MRAIGAVAAIASLATATASTAAPGPAVAAPVTQRSETIAPGLTLTKISDPRGPFIVRILTIDPSADVTLDVTTAGAIGMYARTSVQGAANDALAAVNGGFTVSTGVPLHPFTQDGALRSRGFQVGASFAISRDELHTYVDRGEIDVRGNDLTATRAFSVAEWNTAGPRGRKIAGYTPYGAAIRPPRRACSVRLEPAGPIRFGEGGLGVARAYEVERSRCSARAMAVRPGTTVLASRRRGAGAATLRSMKIGHVVRLRWSIGWSGVMDSIGGMPLLVRDGTAVAPTSCDTYFCERNPRTGIGVTADGSILLVTVDGRRKSSVGMTLIRFARYMIELGAVGAINLDGGGSTTMWVDGLGLVNDPADPRGERPVGNSVLVLPGPDPGEPATMTGSTMTGSPVMSLAPEIWVPPATVAAARRAAALAATDAGSIGGLMDALVAGDLGDPGRLPLAFLRYARIFRAGR